MKRAIVVSLVLGVSLCIGAKFSLAPYSSGYVGKYLPALSERYNADAGLGIWVDVLEFGRHAWYIYYRDDLEMARQTGNVVFDPRYAHWDAGMGFKFFWRDYLARFHYAHDCLHMIDIRPDANKAVFNRFKFSVGSELADARTWTQTNRRDEANALRWFSHPLWFVTYGYYPQSKVIDYLNSRPDYLHDLQLDVGADLFDIGPWELDLRALALFAWRVKPDTLTGKTRHTSLKLTLAGVHHAPGGYAELYLDYYPYIDDPFKAPQGMAMLGVRCGF